jgi:acyl carrier protein
MLSESQIRTAAHESVAEMIHGNVGADEPLISSGRIDSLSILKLMTLLENKLSVRLPAARLQPDDFETVDVIVETVQRVAIPQ